MKRLAVPLSEELFSALQRRASERGVSLAEVAREAIQREVAPLQPWPKGIGMFASGHTDTSRLASDPPPYDGPRDDPWGGTRPKPKSLGMGSSGRPDIAERIGEEEFDSGALR